MREWSFVWVDVNWETFTIAEASFLFNVSISLVGFISNLCGVLI